MSANKICEACFERLDPEASGVLCSECRATLDLDEGAAVSCIGCGDVLPGAVGDVYCSLKCRRVIEETGQTIIALPKSAVVFAPEASEWIGDPVRMTADRDAGMTFARIAHLHQVSETTARTRIRQHAEAATTPRAPSKGLFDFLDQDDDAGGVRVGVQEPEADQPAVPDAVSEEERWSTPPRGARRRPRGGAILVLAALLVFGGGAAIVRLVPHSSGSRAAISPARTTVAHAAKPAPSTPGLGFFESVGRTLFDETAVAAAAGATTSQAAVREAAARKVRVRAAAARRLAARKAAASRAISARKAEARKAAARRSARAATPRVVSSRPSPSPSAPTSSSPPSTHSTASSADAAVCFSGFNC